MNITFMKERRRLEGADEQELEAITREIHAQLRELYGMEQGDAAVGIVLRPARRSSIRNAARFLIAFLLPPIAMVGLLIVLRLVKDGF